jgi:KaiC/GvpD/RAD55 family RecA-like ATPase
MQVTNTKYVRLTTGLVSKGTLFQSTEDLYKHRKKLSQDYYYSLFLYNQKHYETFQKTGSVKGISDVTGKYLVFDFDAVVLDDAKRDALTAYNRIVEAGVPADKIRIYYSGSKGFHLDTCLSEEITPQELENIVFALTGDLSTFDESINNASRIFRLPLTKHHESGLFKIPLSYEELRDCSIDEIKEMAKSINGFDSADLADEHFTIDLPPALVKLKNTLYKHKKATSEILFKEELGFEISDLDISRCPKWLSPDRFALSEGFFYGSESVDTGERNTALLLLCATFKNQGFDRDQTLALLMTTADKQARRTGEEPYTEQQMVNEIINTVFHSAWRGGQFSSDEPLLVKTRERFGLEEPIVDKDKDLVIIKTVGDDFKLFTKSIDENIVKSGLGSLDSTLTLTSGMLVSLLASPGAGKTSFSNLFVQNVSNNNENVLYFSLDMYKQLLFTRLLQKYCNYDMKKIFEEFKTGEPDEALLEAYSQVLENYTNVSFCFRGGMSVEDIEAKIIADQNLRGKKQKLIVIDYLEKVRSQFQDSTANSAYVVSRLSDFCKKYDLLILLLVQPSKISGDPRDEFKSYRSIKGSSAIEQESRVILGLSRVGYRPEDMSNDRFATISILKNSMGPLGRLDFYWDGVAGDFSELDSEGKRDIKRLRDDLAAEKEEKKSGGWDI